MSRNALKHGLLAREVVITAGDGEEDAYEFNVLVDKLQEDYQPVGIMEEMLVQTIATCWWRKARIIRAENGEIRKWLDTLRLDRELRDSDRANLVLAVQTTKLGFFTPENPADQVPLMEKLMAVQRGQTTLRSHRVGLDYLSVLLKKAKAEVASNGYIPDDTAGDIFCEFIFWDYPFALLCAQAAESERRAKDQVSEAIDRNKEAEKEFAGFVSSMIDNRLKRISNFQEYSVAREQLRGNAEARALCLPSAEATDKLLRYEAHLDRQLCRAIDELERLQRQRRGEKVPPPLNINLARRS